MLAAVPDRFANEPVIFPAITTAFWAANTARPVAPDAVAPVAALDVIEPAVLQQHAVDVSEDISFPE